jgi:hypothetical protein
LLDCKSFQILSAKKNPTNTFNNTRKKSLKNHLRASIFTQIIKFNVFTLRGRLFVRSQLPFLSPANFRHYSLISSFFNARKFYSQNSNNNREASRFKLYCRVSNQMKQVFIIDRGIGDELTGSKFKPQKVLLCFIRANQIV